MELFQEANCWKNLAGPAASAEETYSPQEESRSETSNVNFPPYMQSHPLRSSRFVFSSGFQHLQSILSPIIFFQLQTGIPTPCLEISKHTQPLYSFIQVDINIHSLCNVPLKLKKS